MSFYFVKEDAILSKYVDKRKEKIRKLSPKELELVDALRKRYKEHNVMVTELLTIMKILEQIENSDLNYLALNVRRVINSLMRQRNYCMIVQRAVSSVEPNKDEYTCVLHFIKKLEERVDYLKTYTIPENIKLTPIQEYLDIIGVKDFIDAVNARWPNRQAMYQANSGQTNDIQDYVDEIIRIVREHGLYNNYEQRLDAYIQREKERIQKKKEEKAKENLENNLKEAKDNMVLFQRKFYKTVRTFQSTNIIKMASFALKEKIMEFGRDTYVILCTYMYHNKCVYRYVADDGVSDRFSHVTVFKNIKDAEERVKELQAQRQDYVLEIVEIGEKVS